jgi:hypothetical protein
VLHQNFTSVFTRSSLPPAAFAASFLVSRPSAAEEEKRMKLRIWKSISVVGLVTLAFSMASAAMAQCGLPNKPIKPSNWRPQYGATTPQLRLAALDGFEDREPIVGMWHVVFTAQTQNGETIPVPGGVVIDNSVVVWHGDGTEIMNSARSAQDGNFCLGVWKRTGDRTYSLNHIAWQGNVYDPTVPPGVIGAPQDGAQIIEKILLSPDGDSYTGTFTLHAYDTSGNVYTSFTGVLSGKRITTDTPFSALL